VRRVSGSGMSATGVHDRLLRLVYGQRISGRELRRALRSVRALDPAFLAALGHRTTGWSARRQLRQVTDRALAEQSGARQPAPAHEAAPEAAAQGPALAAAREPTRQEPLAADARESRRRRWRRRSTSAGEAGRERRRRSREARPADEHPVWVVVLQGVAIAVLGVAATFAVLMVVLGPRP
jgi:hypothetical protein